ncbi:MAG TPA: hypothetical protein VEC99_04660, partial [Clostridia bacterium]|nr:hypothetical protein [Clostridia bacterium]
MPDLEPEKSVIRVFRVFRGIQHAFLAVLRGPQIILPSAFSVFSFQNENTNVSDKVGAPMCGGGHCATVAGDEAQYQWRTSLYDRRD